MDSHVCVEPWSAWSSLPAECIFPDLALTRLLSSAALQCLPCGSPFLHTCPTPVCSVLSQLSDGCGLKTSRLFCDLVTVAAQVRERCLNLTVFGAQKKPIKEKPMCLSRGLPQNTSYVTRGSLEPRDEAVESGGCWEASCDWLAPKLERQAHWKHARLTPFPPDGPASGLLLGTRLLT